jgi:hypothetical protein
VKYLSSLSIHTVHLGSDAHTGKEIFSIYNKADVECPNYYLDMNVVHIQTEYNIICAVLEE